MSETTGASPQNAPGGSNVGIYALCLVAGIVIGVLGGMLVPGGSGGTGGDAVVAEYNGKSVKASEAFTSIKGRLFELEEDLYRTKEQAIKEFVEQKLLEAEAKKQNTSIEQLVEKEAGGTPEDVGEKEVQDFLTSKGLSLDDPRIKKDDVKEYLKYRKRYEKREAYVAKLEAAANVKIKVQQPQAPIVKVTTDGFPSWGNDKAPVTIVEFSDYQCPYCSKAEGTVAQLKKEYGQDKVKLIYMDMPLPAHQRAYPAALASHCANEQGKFWEFHDKMFQNQAKLEDSDLKGYAKELGLDAGKFGECLDKKKYADLIEKSKKEADKAGIQATPSFLINGRLLQGAQPFERFKEAIDRASKS